jgi:hypothetical protein
LDTGRPLAPAGVVFRRTDAGRPAPPACDQRAHAVTYGNYDGCSSEVDERR